MPSGTTAVGNDRSPDVCVCVCVCTSSCLKKCFDFNHRHTAMVLEGTNHTVSKLNQRAVQTVSKRFYYTQIRHNSYSILSPVSESNRHYPSLQTVTGLSPARRIRSPRPVQNPQNLLMLHLQQSSCSSVPPVPICVCRLEGSIVDSAYIRFL